METTIDLPESLVSRVKLRALKEGRELKDAMTDLLRIGLAASGDETELLARPTVKTNTNTGLPYVDCPYGASPSDEMTPDRVAEVLLEQEVDRHHEAG